MKETNTNEQLFDGLFREELGNASSPVPPGVWEGIASSVSGTTAAGVAGTAGKMALWMKAAVSVIAVTAISVTVYQIMPDKNANSESVKNAVVIEESKNTEPETVISEPAQSSAEEKIKADAGEVNNTDGNSPSNNPVQFKSPYSGNGLQFRTFSETQTNSDPLIKDPAIKLEEPRDNYASNAEDPGNGVQTEPADDVEADNNATPVKPAITPGNDSSEIFVPNTVTPNGDGKNDTYLIRLVNEERVEIIIYDPLSNEILFRTKNKYQGWNCNLPNGDPAPAGNYIVKVIYKFRAKPEAEPIYTKLTILR